MIDETRTMYEINGVRAWPLHSMQQTQSLEKQLSAVLPPHTLMQRAGQATAKLALAIAPHARTIWIACGPGNNGGDGLEAAIQLKQWGKTVIVTHSGQPDAGPIEARLSWQRAIQAGIQFVQQPSSDFDLVIDALLGLGCTRAPTGKMAKWLHVMHSCAAPILSIDLPTGLLPDTGEWLHSDNTLDLNNQRHTLSLLTLKAGLFTADGRDAAGQVWFDDLIEGTPDQSVKPPAAFAVLQAQYSHKHIARAHNSHKGSYGDLMVIGGAPGMSGAAILAAIAGLHAGAGRVYLTLLDKSIQATVALQNPALMGRDFPALKLENGCVVCGCGGSDSIKELLPRVLSETQSLLLDADALNVIASDSALMESLKTRYQYKKTTVLTPHPLEAARLLKCSATEVQSNRIKAATQLSNLTQCIVVLKGSGTVICSPYQTPVINHTGNALLATAGTGDVLAGLIGAKIAQGQQSFSAACDGVRLHGAAADAWALTEHSLDAPMLATSIQAFANGSDDSSF